MERKHLTGAGRQWAGWRLGFAAALCLVTLAAGATSKIDPGEMPKLDPNEGLLVVSVDSDTAVASMRFTQEGTSRGGGFLRGIDEGQTRQLYSLPAGRYHWAKITLFDTWRWSGAMDLSKSDDFTFEVKAGQINYAGDVVYRATGFLRADVRLVNRTLPVLEWLQTEHPALSAQLAFSYNGYYPDPFPEFYRTAKAQVARLPADLDAGRTAPSPGNLPLPPGLLWKPARVEDVALSPDGRLVVEAVRGTGETWGLYLFDLKTGEGQLLVTSEVSFSDIRWESERILLATSDMSAGSRLHAFHVGEPAAGKRSVRRVDGPIGGALVDLLPAEPGTVLFQALDSESRLVVHRLKLDSTETVRKFSVAKRRDRLNVGVEQDLGWFADGRGQLRAAYARRGEDDIVLLHGRDGRFREVMQYHANTGFQPMQLSFDGELFYGFTDDGRAQRELVEFDPASGKVTRTLYSKPGVDLVSVVFDDRRTPIGAVYYQDGRLVADYFDQANRHIDRLLREAFPDRTVAVIQRSRDARQMLLWVDGSDLPPQLYLLDTATGQASLFDETAPELAGRKFARAKVLKVRGVDGLPVEAFLTMPAGAGNRPLVVMPHGGPIGVSDDLHFNRNVQFLASLGYAVLQVNFRGSEGYGKAFREAGHRNYGKLIEEDIDVAIKAALASHPLDESRMCALGASYGGYSAMVSAIRWPQRFRCVVSISGVSDRALFFTASDSGRDAELRKEMERIMGNPSVATDLAEMRAASPLYRYRDLTVPVMLLHGTEDARVDYEHTRRLVRMLNLAGRPPVLMTFDDEGHSLDKPKNVEKAWMAIAGFLGEYLGAPSGTEAQGKAAGAGGATAE